MAISTYPFLVEEMVYFKRHNVIYKDRGFLDSRDLGCIHGLEGSLHCLVTA